MNQATATLMSGSSRRVVLFLIPTLSGGGAERVIISLLQNLDRAKFRLVLIVLDMREAIYGDQVPKDVELIRLKHSRVRYSAPEIMHHLWRMQPDVVFSTLGHLNLLITLLRPLLPKRALYIGREACVVSENLKAYSWTRVWAWAYRCFYPRFDVVVCQSAYMRDDLVSRLAFPPDKAVVIHNPIDIARISRLACRPTSSRDSMWSKSGSEPHLVAAGRLSHEKGFDLLIDALSLCNGTRPHLTLLGDGPLRGTLERLAQARGVADRVSFVGFQKNPYPFFLQADAFVLSSRHEGFPNVVLEALACGTPVIATPAPGGIAEIARAAGGVMLAAAVNAESLSAAIEQLLGGRARLRPITLTEFHLARVVEQYENLMTTAPCRRRQDE